MGHYEDIFYEVYNTIAKHGLEKEYTQQLAKMKTQDHHKYSETRDRMQYACDKVVSLHKQSKSINKAI
tara:strand:+ start:1190 stop:1393 length:204 start_codon:yes stop_codon:yes gene_type:complete